MYFDFFKFTDIACVGFASDERSVSRLSSSPFGWPRPESVVPSSSLNPSPCQLSILWDFVHFSSCGILSCGILSVGILSCGILSCGILSCGILSCGILSCGILSGYHCSACLQRINYHVCMNPCMYRAVGINWPVRTNYQRDCCLLLPQVCPA